MLLLAWEPRRGCYIVPLFSCSTSLRNCTNPKVCINEKKSYLAVDTKSFSSPPPSSKASKVLASPVDCSPITTHWSEKWKQRIKVCVNSLPKYAQPDHFKHVRHLRLLHLRRCQDQKPWLTSLHPHSPSHSLSLLVRAAPPASLWMLCRDT